MDRDGEGWAVERFRPFEGWDAGAALDVDPPAVRMGFEIEAGEDHGNPGEIGVACFQKTDRIARSGGIPLDPDQALSRNERQSFEAESVPKGQGFFMGRPLIVQEGQGIGVFRPLPSVRKEKIQKDLKCPLPKK